MGLLARKVLDVIHSLLAYGVTISKSFQLYIDKLAAESITSSHYGLTLLICRLLT